MARGFVVLLLITLILDSMYGLAPKCNCNCPGSQLVCGKDPTTSALLTFKNPCQMICQNCTHKERWMLIKKGECDKASLNPTRRSLPESKTSTVTNTTPSVKMTPRLPSKLLAIAKAKLRSQEQGKEH